MKIYHQLPAAGKKWIQQKCRWIQENYRLVKCTLENKLAHGRFSIFPSVTIFTYCDNVIILKILLLDLFTHAAPQSFQNSGAGVVLLGQDSPLERLPWLRRTLLSFTNYIAIYCIQDLKKKKKLGWSLSVCSLGSVMIPWYCYSYTCKQEEGMKSLPWRNLFTKIQKCTP